MARTQEKVIAIRLDEAAVTALNAYAIQGNWINRKGEPNISMAARIMLKRAIRAEELRRPVTDEEMGDIYLESARSAWLEMVNVEWRRAIERISRVGLEGGR